MSEPEWGDFTVSLDDYGNVVVRPMKPCNPSRFMWFVANKLSADDAGSQRPLEGIREPGKALAAGLNMAGFPVVLDDKQPPHLIQIRNFDGRGVELNLQTGVVSILPSRVRFVGARPNDGPNPWDELPDQQVDALPVVEEFVAFYDAVRQRASKETIAWARRNLIRAIVKAAATPTGEVNPK